MTEKPPRKHVAVRFVILNQEDTRHRFASLIQRLPATTTLIPSLPLASDAGKAASKQSSLTCGALPLALKTEGLASPSTEARTVENANTDPTFLSNKPHILLH
jgi:hypothetical protein